jgi:putative ABC transport system permease protein
LPYPDPERLVVLRPVDVRTGDMGNSVDHPDVRAWQAEIPELQVAGYSGTRPTLTGLGDPEVVEGARVTDGLLALFGLQPTLGRDIRRDEDVVGGPDVVVVSHDFWQQRLGADPDVLGRTLELSGRSWEIVGVAPEGFDFPDGASLWMPRHHDLDGCDHGCSILRTVGRVEAGTTLGAVQDRLDAVSARLAAEHVDAHRDSGVRMERLLDLQVADVKAALWVLMGAVAMVLLIACANVAHLLLARAGDRLSEVALRATLGARRPRLVRQLLTESFLLSMLGGLGGLALAWWGVRTMLGLAPPGIPRLDSVHLDVRVIAFAVLVVVGVTAVFGLVPALRLARRPLRDVLGSAPRTGGARSSSVSRSLLLSGEVALSLTLLLGAGLLFETLREIRAVELGFATEHVERFRLSVPDGRYDTDGQIRFYDELEARIAELPRVAFVGSAFGVPMGRGSITTSLELLDREPVDPADQPEVGIRVATPGYLEAAGIPLVRGRWFEPLDVRDGEGVTVINQAMAERFWPDGDPLGKQLKASVSWGFDGDPVRTVVGVVGDVRTRGTTREDDPAMYLPEAQFGVNSAYVTIRLRPPASSALVDVRRILGEMDPSLAISGYERVEDVIARDMAPTRFYMTLMGIFSILALLLAAVGLYGVVAYAVSRRTREIGIRIALGAGGDDVVGMVMREGAGPALLGVVVGLGTSWFASRALASLLYGVEPQDPLVLALATGILLVVVAAATLVPARHASRVAPSVALREE